MRNVFTVRDFQGIPVVLKFTTWENHILKRHPEMRGYLEALKVILTRPARAYRNTSFKHGLSLWRFGLGKAKRAKQWIGMVVNYKQHPLTKRWHGEVVTAYFADTTPKDEESVL